MLKTAATAPTPPTTTLPITQTNTAIKPMQQQQQQQQHTEINHNTLAAIKMERRASTTSESSLEHLDLGHTPKKLNTHTSATSTPHIVGVNDKCNSNNNSSNNNNNNNSSTTPLSSAYNENTEAQPPRRHSIRQQIQQPSLPHDSDEANDYDDEESADEKQQQQQHNSTRTLHHRHHHHHHHHKRRSCGRMDKRSVQLIDNNSENPNSLRKKFRFNRSTAAAATAAEVTNNESGFVDGSSSSQLLNSSTMSTISNVTAIQTHLSNSHHSPLTTSATGGSQSSSASSSPHGGAGTSASASASSSPESGIGERDDMKFVCPICEVVSATPHEFTNHIRCHNYSSGDTENFSCRICSKVLSSASSLDRHVLVHTGERPFNCKYCHLTFTTNGNMHRHMRTHKQHQHNHHHRRNSNGTATAKQSNNGSNNNHNALAPTGTTQLAPVSSANAATSASVNAQLTNGSGEGVKAAASLTPATTNLGVIAPTTIAATAVAAAHGIGANGRRLNGSSSNNNNSNNGVESYESDGGCSTDSSSAISQQSSNNHNHNNNNNINNYNSNSNNNNNNNNNNNMKTNNNNNNFKRKNSDNLDEGITLMKRRVKTTINNNNIINVGYENHQRQHDAIAASTTTTAGVDEQTHVQREKQEQQQHLFACPVCNASEFDSMLALSTHIDSEHCDIPAKCRLCDVVFHTHRQLNVHPCTGKMKMASEYKDLNFTDFSSEKFPLIAKSLCEQSLRSGGGVSEKLECTSCSRTFPCTSALEMHQRECGHLSRLYSSAADLSTATDLVRRAPKVRSVSESSAGIDDEAEAENEAEDEELTRREKFFKHLYLKNKSDLNQSICESPQHSMDGDDHLDRSIKYETDCEKLAQQSHDSSKDLADIQSILNMTSSSSTSNFLKNFEQTVNTPSSNYGLDKDEEEAQDAFTSEFRKMKLRGEFPCKLCTAVFPNLRALKGHNRVHLSAAGPSGPFRCNMCPYSICDKAALVRHMRTHNGDRPYECAVCNYAFTTKANCERHLRNRHAKTTRDDVKRAIIYHPSEDSSCDDPTKKLHLFSSPEFDDDVDLHYQHHQPKDRSTPVSHLKEMLTSDIGVGSTSKAIKIQVKSLEQLLDKSTASSSYNDHYEDRPIESNHHAAESSPIDLSMDVLDLSKKPSKPVVVSEEPARSISSASTNVSEPQMLPLLAPEGGDNSKFDMSVLEKNQQYLMAQQQLINDAMPKIVDPAHYFQQLYRNLVFPPINPFFLQNSFLPNNLGDLQKYAPLMNRMFGTSPVASAPQDAAKSNTNTVPNPSSTLLPQVSPLMSEKSSISSMSSASPVNANQMLTKSLTSPSSTSLNIPRHPHMTPTVLPGGPVKMVIKNGVLMPKQKQRRYRTERPFACEHCSARFTLRSNMERHVKQQHPQFYAQRQRSGHHIMRGRGSSSAVAMNSITHLQAAIAAHNGGASNVSPASISEQVKYAILAQQLKARKDTDLLQQALAHGSSSVAPSHLLLGPPGALPQVSHEHQLNISHLNSSNANGSMEDDDPKLVIDEDDDIEEIPDDDNEEDQFQDQEDEADDSFYEEPQFPAVPTNTSNVENKETNESAKKVAETILEQAIKASSTTNSKPTTAAPAATTMKSMIAQAESVGKFLKEVASSPFKDESQDLVPVSKLVDNATTNSMSFNNYFRPSDVANHMEQSDEEGLVASGSASESNNSGTEDISTCVEPKKKSAYSLAPNRVSCPYCQRMFPWSSSLRRHILTHTGQKPFKCSHCPLLFTTKSNCDRHLLRKHGNVESAVSVYVPTEDVNEPIPVPKSVEEIEQQQRQREEEERKRKAEEALKLEKERLEKEQRQQQELEQQQLLKQIAVAAQFNQLAHVQAAAAQANSSKIDINSIQSSSELPYKCHLCDSSFGERFQCLDHIKLQHAHDFALLLSKGAIDTDPEPNQVPCTEEEEKRPGDECTNGRTGKYPDYSNRKVICAFCVRRFWSTEDLRRHMRTHSGERPFQCDICLRKFTLKHSMLRHMKKHNGRHHGGLSSSDLSNAANSGSDLSDDEREAPMPMPMPTVNSLMTANTLAMPTQKIQELLNKANEWRQNRMTIGEQKENIAEEHNNQTDLIGNLLGISDQGILNKLLSSADEAAKLLGVDNK